VRRPHRLGYLRALELDFEHVVGLEVRGEEEPRRAPLVLSHATQYQAEKRALT